LWSDASQISRRISLLRNLHRRLFKKDLAISTEDKRRSIQQIPRIQSRDRKPREQHKIEVSRDITFNEKMAFKKSIEGTIEEEEIEEPNEESTKNENDEKEQLDHPMEPCENIDSYIVPKTKKRPAWLEATLQDVERLKVPEGTFRKSKRPKRFSSYAAYMTKLLDEEPTTFEEAVQKGQWKKAMTEEHQSIMKNEVWEIVPRPKEKSVELQNGYTRSNMQQTEAWINTRQDS
jgi:hypothetical protein